MSRSVGSHCRLGRDVKSRNRLLDKALLHDMFKVVVVLVIELLVHLISKKSLESIENNKEVAKLTIKQSISGKPK